jgi:hypothetical protein
MYNSPETAPRSTARLGPLTFTNPGDTRVSILPLLRQCPVEYDPKDEMRTT